MGESTGEENSNLYIRGVNEGRSGELLEASDMLDILEVFGEDGMRSYLMGTSRAKRMPPKTRKISSKKTTKTGSSEETDT
jgi:hypothetical protein